MTASAEANSATCRRIIPLTYQGRGYEASSSRCTSSRHSPLSVRRRRQCTEPRRYALVLSPTTRPILPPQPSPTSNTMLPRLGRRTWALQGRAGVTGSGTRRIVRWAASRATAPQRPAPASTASTSTTQRAPGAKAATATPAAWPNSATLPDLPDPAGLEHDAARGVADDARCGTTTAGDVGLHVDGHDAMWEDFRTHGKAMVDFMADYAQGVAEHPVRSQVKPGYLQERLPAEAPEEPESFDSVMQDVHSHIMPGITHWQHPSFFGFYPANNSGPALLGDMMAGAFGCIASCWVGSPAATELETIVMDWLAKASGLPDIFLHNGKGGGVIQGSASEATLVAVLAARGRKKDHTDTFVLYCSDQSHSSVIKAALIAGIPTERVRVLPTEEAHGYALHHDTLAAAIAEDVAAGLTPGICVSTVGTTTSCAFDDLTKIGSVCQEAGIWHHCDAAYAGAATICDEYRPLIDGVETADSYAFNPNKWLLINFDCNAMWVQDRSALLDALSITPPYLRSKEYDEGLVADYRDWQIPLGRRMRSLKVWFTIRMFGVQGLRTHVRTHCALATRFAGLVEADDRFEVVTDPALAVVLFRLKGDRSQDGWEEAEDELNEVLLAKLNDSGRMFMVSSKLHDRTVLRFVVGSPQTGVAHVDGAWADVVAAVEQLD